MGTKKKFPHALLPISGNSCFLGTHISASLSTDPQGYVSVEALYWNVSCLLKWANLSYSALKQRRCVFWCGCIFWSPFLGVSPEVVLRLWRNLGSLVIWITPCLGPGYGIAVMLILLCAQVLSLAAQPSAKHPTLRRFAGHVSLLDVRRDEILPQGGIYRCSRAGRNVTRKKKDDIEQEVKSGHSCKILLTGE